MSARLSVVGSGLLAAVILWPASAASQVALDADAGKPVATTPSVVLTLKINDKESGLTVEAKKSVPKGSNAFQVLRDTVAVKYKTYPKLGAFVTGLCGVDAAKGKVWTLTVDTKWSKVGIERLTLEHDTVIEWTPR
jgi:Domain of unknown function (DUF4430)